MKTLALIFVLLAWCNTAFAGAIDDCSGSPTQKSIDACSAVIDDPASNSLDRAWALAERGMAYSQLEKYAEAVSDFDRAIDLNGNSADALNNRAWAYFRWQNSTRGMADVEKSLALQPNYAAAWDTRAHLRQLLGNHDGAFNDYEAAVGIGGEAMVRLYQCGLTQRGLYNGGITGVYDVATRDALKRCAFVKDCDPLPKGMDFILPEEATCGDTIS